MCYNEDCVSYWSWGGDIVPRPPPSPPPLGDNTGAGEYAPLFAWCCGDTAPPSPPVAEFLGEFCPATMDSSCLVNWFCWSFPPCTYNERYNYMNISDRSSTSKHPPRHISDRSSTIRHPPRLKKLLKWSRIRIKFPLII